MDVKIRRDRARRRLGARLLHENHRCGPVTVAIEERAANASVEDAVEGLVLRAGPPFAHQLVALFEAANAQSLVVGRPASEAAIVRRVGFLNGFHRRANATTSGKKSWKRRSSSGRESTR